MSNHDRHYSGRNKRVLGDEHRKPKERRGVVLLSGGLDSMLVLALAKSMGWHSLALTVDYGQKNRGEIPAAQKIAKHFEAEWLQASVDTELHSVLTGGKRPEYEDTRSDFYVPGRNTILLSLAASVAEANGMSAIMIGANLEDYTGFPDCRREFFDAFEVVADASAGRRIEVIAPLVSMRKVDVVYTLANMGAPYEFSTSCYHGTDCGECDACNSRIGAIAAQQRYQRA